MKKYCKYRPFFRTPTGSKFITKKYIPLFGEPYTPKELTKKISVFMERDMGGVKTNGRKDTGVRRMRPGYSYRVPLQHFYDPRIRIYYRGSFTSEVSRSSCFIKTLGTIIKKQI